MSDSENYSYEILPFSETKQQAILGYLIKDPKLFMRTRQFLPTDAFLSIHCNRLWAEAIKFSVDYGCPPTEAELKERPEFLKMDPKSRGALYTTLNVAVQQTTNYHFEALFDEVESWLHARAYYKASLEAQSLYHKGSIEDATQRIRDLVKELDKTHVKPTDKATWDNPAETMKEQDLMIENACTWGLTQMDRLLLPESTCGGLLPGDTTLILAPSDIGKTTSVLTIVRHNIVRRKHALVITHEGQGAQIQQKIWCACLGMSRPELRNFYINNPDLAQKWSKLLEECITYIPFNKAGSTVEELEARIRQEADEHHSQYGKYFDLFVDDYPGKLNCVAGKKGNLAKRHIDAYVYNYLIQLAREYGWHALLPIQTNRTGAQINKGLRKNEERVLEMEDVSESYGPMQDAANVISINRSPEDAARNRLGYSIAKCKTNEKGWVVVAKTDFGHALSHSDQLGCVYYRGNEIVGDKLDTLMEQYKNGEIPASELIVP